MVYCTELWKNLHQMQMVTNFVHFYPHFLIIKFCWPLTWMFLRLTGNLCSFWCWYHLPSRKISLSEHLVPSAHQQCVENPFFRISLKQKTDVHFTHNVTECVKEYCLLFSHQPSTTTCFYFHWLPQFSTSFIWKIFFFFSCHHIRDLFFFFLRLIAL